MAGSTRAILAWAGLIAGPLLALGLWATLPRGELLLGDRVVPFGDAGRGTAAVGAWMAVWWMTEAVPVSATALLPLVLFPLLGVGSLGDVAAPYAHELIFLFMGGFLLALSMERWGLHERIALTALRWVGTRPRRLVGGFMVVSAVLSMWVSNSATAVMMLPMATSVVRLLARGGRTPALGAGRGVAADDPGAAAPDPLTSPFATCLLLGIAYGASIGGVGTLIGTPPNLFLASYVGTNLGRDIGFVEWMAIGVPLVVVFLPITWWLLTYRLFPLGDGRDAREVGDDAREAATGDRARPAAATDAPLAASLAALGPMKRGEWVTFVVFLGAAAAWIGRPWLVGWEWHGSRPLAGLTDAGIAMTAALLLFVIPVEPRTRTFTMDWDTALRLPWGLLILFGGGLSLAAAVREHGVGELIGQQASALAGLPTVVIVVAVVTLMIFLTELTSNTASTATLVPILASIAPALGASPLTLIVPATIAASCAFMLPVATPPNAVVFGSGHVTIAQMCRAGLQLNLIGVVVITGLAYAVFLPLLGVVT